MLRLLFNEWSSEIQAYCLKNGLSFEKAKKMAKGQHKDDFLSLAYPDPEKSKSGLGLLDDTPMPAVLFIFKNEDGSLRFEQTEFTEKYLRDDEELTSEPDRKIG